LSNIFGSKSQTHDNKTVDFFHQLFKHIFVNFLCNDILLIHKTYCSTIVRYSS